jgi:hypothetical protein
LKLPKYIIFYFFLFFLLYFEDRVSFGGVNLSNIWKLFSVLFFGFVVILKKLQFGISKFDIIIFFLTSSFLFNLNGLIGFSDLEELILISILPISYYSFYFLFKNNYPKLKRMILSLSVFFIFSGIPFLLGIIEPVSSFNEERLKFAESYQMNSAMLVGFFKHPALSSLIFVFSTVIVWVTGFIDNNSKKLVFLFLCFIGCFEVYRAFTRTGWVLLVLFPLLFLYYSESYSKIKKIRITFLIILILTLVYSSSQVIQNRVLSQRENSFTQSDDLVKKIGSGRNLIILLALESVISKGSSAIFLGLGKDNAIESSGGAVAHNRFVEIFVYGGLKSLIVYLFYLFYLSKEILMRKSKDNIFILSISLYVLMLFSLLPSHGLPLWGDVLFGGVIALNRISYELKNKTQKNENLPRYKSKFV